MRYEYKYLVPIEQHLALRQAVLPFLYSDPYAARQTEGHYTVRSIYFDTPGFEMYHTKLEGVAHRMKVRLRGYNLGGPDSEVFMEIKRKYEHPILKNRSLTTFGIVQRLFRGESIEAFGDRISHPDNARRFFYQILSRNMRPVINVIYEREPYVGRTFDPENDFRLTFDLHLRSVAYPQVDALFEETDTCFAFPGYFILEIKFNRYCPAWLKPLLEDFQLRKEPASKYVGAINANRFINPNRYNDAFAKNNFWAHAVYARQGSE
ncbi:MAG: polyphosphate polymerase domain-containing protein [Lewinellaceae bacterium]|nr:polyphosphate polymerase domain-containing protein [Lewinellaceae bacterium]